MISPCKKLPSDFNIIKTTLYNHFYTKDSMIDTAAVYKLNSINDYKKVLFEKNLDYFERLRKEILSCCVQIFEISRNLLKEVKEKYPKSWLKVVLSNNKCYMNYKTIIN